MHHLPFLLESLSGDFVWSVWFPDVEGMGFSLEFLMAMLFSIARLRLMNHSWLF